MRNNFKYLTIERVGQGLEDEFLDAYGRRGEEFAGYVNWIGRFALENIANSDILYHDVEHTMLVTTVGQQAQLDNVARRKYIGSSMQEEHMASILAGQIARAVDQLSTLEDGIGAHGKHLRRADIDVTKMAENP